MDGRQRAARAVAARRGELGMTQQGLAAAAGVDLKTIGSLERRSSWPIAKNRARIERALGWPSGEMDRIADEDEATPDPVPPRVYDAVEQAIPPKYQEAVIDAIRRELSRDAQRGAAGRHESPGVSGRHERAS